jgi:hypothetical protein
MPKSEPVIITIPLDADIVEGIVKGDKVCLSLISKAVQAAIEQGYHLRKTEETKVLPAPAGHRCVITDDAIWDFLQANSKITGQKISEV